MIEAKQKLIQLSPVPQIAKDEFTLDTVAGRDSIADQIKRDIDEFCVQAFDDGPRSHLGASEIGHECERYLWFKFRWAKHERFSGRMLRLFNRGHLEEDRIIAWLRGIGFIVKQVEVDGKQTHVVDVGGHFGGSSDSSTTLPLRYAYKEPYYQRMLLEFKTSNDKNFQQIIGSGFRKSKPQYWSQACTYGYKLGLQYCLFICVNKNDDELDVEVVELDHELGKAEIAKAEKIILSVLPPPRISDDASFWKCKFCAMNGVCHLGEQLEKNCRSCQYAEPVDEGQWKCNNFQQIIPKEFLATGCDAWVSLPH